MNIPWVQIIKYLVGAICRHGLTALLTLFVVNHYIGADIAEKLMKGDTVTLYQGYGFSLQTVVNYLADAFVISILPICVAVFMRLRAKLKERLAILLPARGIGQGEAQIKQILSDTPFLAKVAATVTLDPHKILDATTSAGVGNAAANT